MNSYRLANGLVADFTYTDREKAKQVYGQFKDGCLRHAAHFLSRRYATRNSLICDVIQIASGGIPARTEVQMAVPVVAAPVTPAMVPPSAVPAQPVTAIPAPPAPSTPAPVVGTATPVIGNRGSSDPEALTDEDVRVISSELPRGARKNIAQTDFSGSEKKEDTDPIPPDEWRREFERIWRLLVGASRA
jgi:hypothetical protein